MPPADQTPRSFQEEAAKVGVSSYAPLDVRPIRVRRIVGTAGKAGKIGSDFLPLESGPAGANYKAILKRMEAGEDLPPITVYQLGNRYFVIDGHTRVAAAKASGKEFIDAEVIEAMPRKEGEVNLTYYARKEFERKTGLQEIRLTAPWRYHLLLHHIEGFRLYLELSRGRKVSLPEAARIWYRTQYEPMLQEIRRRKLRSTTGGRTAGDVYTDILKSWAEEEGLAVGMQEMLDYYEDRLHTDDSPLDRAKRMAGTIADASMPRVIADLRRPQPQKFVDMDVEADLAAAQESADRASGV